MFLVTLLLVHTTHGDGQDAWETLYSKFQTGPASWSTDTHSWAQQDCVPLGGGCQFTSDCCLSPRRECINGQTSDECEMDQPAVVCKDTRAEGFDKHHNKQYYGSDISRKCTSFYNYEEETQCNNGQNWYDSGDRRTAVQKRTPVYCSVREKRRLSPLAWPRPEFDCKTNQGVSPNVRIGMKLSMNWEQCHGYFMHADWSFTFDQNSHSCYRIIEGAPTSANVGHTTCIKTRSANPVIGSADDKARQAEIANGNYIKTPVNTDKCPEGSVVVDDVDRCRAAAKKLGMKFNEDYSAEKLRSWETSPKGCLYDTSRGVFLNEEYTSSKHPTQARICEQGGRAPPSWWAAEEPDTDHECAENCREWWRGDNRCDAGCNVASCNFDDGDCGAAMDSEKAVGETVAMHAAPTSDVPVVVTIFAAFGFGVTLYGAYKHFTKQ